MIKNNTQKNILRWLRMGFKVRNGPSYRLVDKVYNPDQGGIFAEVKRSQLQYMYEEKYLVKNRDGDHWHLTDKGREAANKLD